MTLLEKYQKKLKNLSNNQLEVLIRLSINELINRINKKIKKGVKNAKKK